MKNFSWVALGHLLDMNCSVNFMLLFHFYHVFSTSVSQLQQQQNSVKLINRWHVEQCFAITSTPTPLSAVCK